MADKETKKVKQPGAKKRILQSRKRYLRNRITKSRTKTAIRALHEAQIENAAPQKITDSLSSVYSLVDKAVKKGVFHKNKGARIKSRMTLKLAKSAA